MVVSELVDEYISSSSADIVSTLKEVSLNDPVLCREILDSIKRKLYSQDIMEQSRAIDLLDKVVDAFDLTLHQVLNEKEFLSALEKVVSRESSVPAVVEKVKALFTKWVLKFSGDQDILPNFAVYHSRLVEQGFLEPIIDKGPAAPAALVDAPTDSLQVMDNYLLNEAEGQDPDEFKAEVKETLKLFDEVYAVIRTSKLSGQDEISRREALISLAANLDRYSEQFALWIEQLEPGPYMEEAMGLNDKVTEALQKYKVLRSSALKRDETSSEDSSSGDSSDDD